MQTVVDGSRISERTAGNIVQSRGLVQLPERQRATIGTDLRAMEFQPHPTVETEPDITRFACTLRVIHPYSPHNMLKYNMLPAVGGANVTLT